MKFTKRKIITTVLIITGFILSFIAGIVLASYHLIHQGFAHHRNQLVYEAYEQLTVCNLLKEGKIEEAIKELDHSAILNLWGSSVITWMPREVSKWKEHNIKLLQEAKAYYEKYPEPLNINPNENAKQVKQLLDKVPQLERKGIESDFAKIYTGKTTPPLQISQWFNHESKLENLRGKIVLLDFWGMWCGSCVSRLPKTQKLYEKYNKLGLEVICIHSARKADPVAISEFLKNKNYTFSVGIDEGYTAKNYAVTNWPTYYLLDKQGHLIHGPTHSPPEEIISSLLEN